MSTTTERATQHSVHVNDADLYYLEVGSPDSPPLVLLHGGLVSTSPRWTPTPLSYSAHLETLANTFRVIAPDTRGSGRSKHSSGTISMTLLADDVAGLTDKLGLDRPAICGFSEGGLTATIFGLRHPGIARALVNDAGYDMFNPAAVAFTMLRITLGGSPEATSTDPEAAEASFSADPDMAAVFALMKADQDEGQGQGHWRTYLELAFPRLTTWPGYGFADLAAIDVPTLVLVGDRDHFCSVEEGVEVYRQLPQGQLAILPGTGHVITAAKVATTIDFLTNVT
jgi:pimeloyl-ACP methyl ester carboxylesterase